jgi:hypothetical protein
MAANSARSNTDHGTAGGQTCDNWRVVCRLLRCDMKEFSWLLFLKLPSSSPFVP